MVGVKPTEAELSPQPLVKACRHPAASMRFTEIYGCSAHLLQPTCCTKATLQHPSVGRKLSVLVANGFRTFLSNRQCFCSSLATQASRTWSSSFLACQTWQRSPRSPIAPDSRTWLDSPTAPAVSAHQHSLQVVPSAPSSASCRTCTQLQLNVPVSTQQSPEPVHSKEHRLLHGCFTSCDAFLHSLFHTEADEEVDQEDLVQQMDFAMKICEAKLVLEPLRCTDHVSAEDFTDNEFQLCSPSCLHVMLSGSCSAQEVISSCR